MPQVNISLDASGGRRMADVTKTSVGRRMAVIFIESRTRDDVDRLTGERKNSIQGAGYHFARNDSGGVREPVSGSRDSIVHERRQSSLRYCCAPVLWLRLFILWRNVPLDQAWEQKTSGLG